MAIRGPATSVKLMQILSQLGTGLRGVVDPGFEERQRTEEFLLANPEIARSLRRGMEAGDARQADLAADATAQGDVQPANPLSSRGFDPGQAREALRLAGAMSPSEQVGQRIAESLLEQDAPEAIAGQQVAQAEAGTAEAGFNLELFDQLREEGVPAKEAIARARGAEAETAQAEFTVDYLDELDPAKQAQAENMGNEAKRVLSEVKREQGEDYLQFREQVLNGAVPGVSRGDLLFAESNPTLFQGLLQREKMNLQDRISRLKNMREGREFQIEALKTKQDLRGEIDEVVSRIHSIQTGEIDVGEDELKREIQNFNQMVSDFSEVFPGDAQAYYAQFVNELIGSDVEFKSAPSFFGTLTDSPRLVKFGVGVLEKARNRMGELSGEELQRFKEMSEPQKEAFVNEKFRKVQSDLMQTDLGRELTKNLSGQARRLFLQDVKDTVRTSIASSTGEVRTPREGPAGSLGEVQVPPVDLSKSPLIDAIIEFFQVNPNRPGRSAPSGLPTGAIQ